MNSNNLYTLNEKKPLSQSKIFAENNHLRLPSTHIQNRNSNSEMYSSNIFMKTSSLMNQQSQPSFFQPRQPLSPHYPKPPLNNNIQYIPQYVPPMRQLQNNYFPVPLTKDVIMERALGELREKIDGIEKRLQVRRSVGDGINKKGYLVSQGDQLNIIQIEDNVINSDRFKQMITSIFEQRFQTYTKPIYQKMKQLDQTMSFSTNGGAYSEKLIRLQQSFLRSQSQKLHQEQLANRIKTIEKTIREMGEDIHLVNDKEEGLCSKIDNELMWLRNQLKAVKGWEKKWVEIQAKNVELKQTVEQLMKRVKSSIDSPSSTQDGILIKLKQLQSKVQSIPLPSQIDRSFDKYPSQPIILKYIQRFQILHNNQQQSQYQQVTINEMTYYIDEEGYLLDADAYYLISKGDRVRLSGAHLQLLQTNNILI